MLCNDFITLQNCHFVYDTIYSDSDFLPFVFKKKKQKKLSNPLKYVQNGNRRLFHTNQIPAKHWFRVLLSPFDLHYLLPNLLTNLPFHHPYGMYIPAFWPNFPIHNSLVACYLVHMASGHWRRALQLYITYLVAFSYFCTSLIPFGTVLVVVHGLKPCDLTLFRGSWLVSLTLSYNRLCPVTSQSSCLLVDWTV
jgi:hypothetical protein